MIDIIKGLHNKDKVELKPNIPVYQECSALDEVDTNHSTLNTTQMQIIQIMTI